MADTANLILPLMSAAQSQKHVTHNEAVLRLDVLVQLAVKSRTLTAPPSSPSDGDRYLIASGATGAWSGKDLNVTYYSSGVWVFLPPRKGWMLWDEVGGALFTWTGSAWIDFVTASGALKASGLSGGSVLQLGVNTASSTTNRLAVKSNALLFSHDDVTPGTGDMRVTLNKSAAAKNVGFTFQDAFSTRALFGLLADDHFTIKVSPNGSSFFTGLNIRNADGHVGLAGANADANNGLIVNGNILFNTGNAASQMTTVNKQAAANDAGFTFQTNFSTRAIFGTLASDNFTIKVSPNGSSFTDAIVVDATTGYVTFNNGIAVGSNKGVYSPYSISNDLYPLQSTLPPGISHASVAPTEAPAFGGLLTVNHSANRCFQLFVDGQTGSVMVRANHVSNPDPQNDWTQWYKIWSQLDQGSGSGLTADKVTSYTIATLPSASSRGAGALVFISNESGGAVLAFSDGTNWRRVTDRAIAS